MPGLEDLLGGALGGDAIAKIAAHLGTTSEAAQSGIGAALPQLLGKLKATADDPQHGAALAESLRDNNGEDLEDLDGVLNRSGSTGSALMGQLLGSDADSVQADVAANSGLDKSQAAGLLGMLGPLVLGAAGRASGTGVAPSPQGLSAMLGGLLGGSGGAGGPGGLLGGLLGGSASLGNMVGGSAAQQTGGAGGALGGIGNMLDRDKDGSFVDDLANMASNGGTRRGIVAKLLGMLGRK